MRQSHRNVRRHGGTAVLWGISFLLVAFALLLMTSCDNAKAVAAMADFLQPKACPATPAGGKTLLPEEPAADALPGQAAPVPEVELQLQNPELPNGCEVTSLAMVLTAAGYPADKVELCETCLPMVDFTYSDDGQWRYGPSPEEAFAGIASSASGGWYCFEQPILDAGNTWIAANGGGAQMAQLSGLSQAELDALLAGGTPVVAWVTQGYQAPYRTSTFSWLLPSGEEYVPYNNLHCVTVADIYGDQYLVANPLQGWEMVDRDEFWSSFESMGCRAVTVDLGQLDSAAAAETGTGEK